MPELRTARLLLSVTLLAGALPGCTFGTIPAQFHEGMRPEEVQSVHRLTLAEYAAKVDENRRHTVLKKRGAGLGPKLDDVYASLPSDFVAPDVVDFLAAAENPNYRPRTEDRPGNEKYLPILARRGTELHARVVSSDLVRERWVEPPNPNCREEFDECRTEVRSKLAEELEQVVVTMDVGSLIPAAEIDRYEFTLWPQPNRAAGVYAVPLDTAGQVDRTATAYYFSLYKMEGVDTKQAMRIEWTQ